MQIKPTNGRIQRQLRHQCPTDRRVGLPTAIKKRVLAFSQALVVGKYVYLD